jgi:hypothetical protein
MVFPCQVPSGAYFSARYTRIAPDYRASVLNFLSTQRPNFTCLPKDEAVVIDGWSASVEGDRLQEFWLLETVWPGTHLLRNQLPWEAKLFQEYSNLLGVGAAPVVAR